MWAFREIEAPQQSEEWFRARAGRLTGSAAKNILATIRSGEAAARRDYRIQLVTEQLTGEPQIDDFKNAAMQRGIDLEPVARAALEADAGYLIRQTGFLACTGVMAGCSLDGDVEEYTGIVELKCPKSATHLRYLRENVMPEEHRAQILHNMLITGAQWCDFASFDDRFPPDLRLWRIRIKRDEAALAAYETEAKRFLAEVKAELDAVQKFRLER